jgi:hypothetical protein
LGWLLVGDTVHTTVGDVSFVGVTQASGLGVRRDPGVPLVWAGFIGCLLGLVLMFYFPLQQGYVAVSASDEGDVGLLRLRLRGGMMSNAEADSDRLLSEIAAVTGSERARGARP